MSFCRGKAAVLCFFPYIVQSLMCSFVCLIFPLSPSFSVLYNLYLMYYAWEVWTCAALQRCAPMSVSINICDHWLDNQKNNTEYNKVFLWGWMYLYVYTLCLCCICQEKCFIPIQDCRTKKQFHHKLSKSAAVTHWKATACFRVN